MGKSKKNIKDKLWGAGFSQLPKEQAVLFAAGRDVKSLVVADEILVPYEVEASMAYVKALYEQKIILKKDLNKLLIGLKEIGELYKKGKFKLDVKKEDVHTNIEVFLTKKYGIDIVGKMHSGRSRSEQGIVNILLYLKDFNEVIKKSVKELIKVLKQQSKKYSVVVVPGYTHYQQATVTTFGNILDAYLEIFKKDLKKLLSWNDFEEISPLGGAAAYGSVFPIDKKKINKHLKLKQVFSNEIQVMTFKGDAEILMVFNLAVLMNHLSSLAQTLIIFSTKEFDFIEISDEYLTGSSIMPQKKNPDCLEVMKAKASMCHGYLMSLLSLTKASFIGYNRDHQWSKYLVMDAVNEVMLAPKIMTEVIKTMKVKSEKMKHWINKGFILSQTVMESLSIEFKLPMRLAKMVIEETVKKCQKKENFDLQTLNRILKKYQLNIVVNVSQFKKWTDPLIIAKKQMKKEKYE